MEVSALHLARASPAASPACRPTSAAPPAPASAPAPPPSRSPNYNLLQEKTLVRESAHRLLGDFGGNFGRTSRDARAPSCRRRSSSSARPWSAAASGSSSSPAT
ncbi:uncharacterized protein LOC123410981 [Hordeum vulgare subsp. vulgare]|uniref:uncharacterized protein LOC123410981 n=1 Tax=Hordeum vulgare subsp. vulgare TaxID=112509 RepID=UPI001D1A42DF|nr:uncharacterized protein LOC123410981 [Hordeum vulgare subsp. vulgare]KAI4973187.1 hypothetical protein ZWY2020_028895 [Hordeum vulgare]